MNASHPTSRRTVLAGTGAGLVVAFTAACSSADEPVIPLDAGEAGDPSADVDPTVEAAAGATPLAKLDDIPVGSAVAAESPDGKPLIISRPEEGTVVAFSAICTHQACTVAPKGQTLNCPCHGSRFDAATGGVLRGPASKPLRAFAVHVDGKNVVSGAA
jgi:cytochrome b6-f complex iron-sulfur subunit